ncbi:MAG: UTP--glucose-1-phosphate uridylyltransferase [Armatimonadota bacterium]|nr:UTP--glucose-1-phosphate uridylyltransferase [Armatimonadota bacterium]
MPITRAIVPAGGKGTRLFPVTKAQPKEMLPLGTRPVIQGVAEELVSAGVTDILIITGAGKSPVEDHFDPTSGLTAADAGVDGWPPYDDEAIQFYFTRQGEPRGLGDAVRCGERFAGEEHVIVALGDCIITSDQPAAPLRRMLAAHAEHEADASILVQRVSLEATGRYGIVQPGRELAEGAFEMDDIIEKPGPEDAPSRYAVAARYVFSPTLFPYLADLEPGKGAEIQLTDAVRAMIADGHRVLGVPLQEGERRLDVGNFESYSRAFFRTMLTDEVVGEGLRRYAANLLEHLRDASHPDPDLPSDA